MRKNNKNTSTHPDIHWKEYFMICGIPAGLFLLIKLLYTLSFGTCFTVFLPWHTLPFLMLAGGCLYFFLKHSPVIGLQHFRQILLFTTAYSFCAYGLLQETSISSLLRKYAGKLSFFAFYPFLYLYALFTAGNRHTDHTSSFCACHADFGFETPA